jgi:serine/threonine protein kinase
LGKKDYGEAPQRQPRGGYDVIGGKEGGMKTNLALGARIGAGYFGAVHLATDPVHDQVAVKVIRQDPQETAAAWTSRKANLLAEGQRLRQAEHENVVRVHYIAEADTDDAIFLVMEYCTGGSLQTDYETGPLLLDEIRKIATDVTLGLRALHARGFLHRDIKPGNLLKDARGAIKLGDFGLVTDNLIWGYGSQQGYLDHVAFEVWRGDGTSVRSDIWALGMSLYRLIHGERWCEKSPAPRDLIRQGGFARSLAWLPHVPNEWRRLLRAMMHDDPQSRVQSTDALLAAIAKLPSPPNWKCKVSANRIQWRRQSKGRRITVTLNQLSARKFEWLAVSKSIGKGRSRTLGRSNGQISKSQALRELEAFLAPRS